MKPRRPDGDRLVRVASWGQVLLREAGAPSSGIVLEQINVRGDDPGPSLALAEAWVGLRHPAIAPALSVQRVRLPAGEALRLERRAPRGSTLEELLRAHGPLDGVMLAALYSELLEGVLRCHRAGLTLGRLGPSDLFVCPPGVRGVAALQAFDAGLPSLIRAASGPIGAARDRRFDHVFEHLEVVAPEVQRGDAAGIEADIYMLCAGLARALLGREVHEGGDRWAVMQRAREGLGPERSAELERAGPGLGELVARGMSVAPLLRRGVPGELARAFDGLLGEDRRARIHAGRGGEPWAMGSPIIALAAFVRARPFADRFARADIRGSPEPATGSSAASHPSGPAEADRARLAEALQRLQLDRARREREEPARMSTALRALVVFAVLAVAWAIAFFGVERTREIIAPSRRAAPAARARKPPPPPPPRVLYRRPAKE